MSRRGAVRKNSTGSVPAAVNRYVPIVARSACMTGERPANVSNIGYVRHSPWSTNAAQW